MQTQHQCLSPEPWTKNDDNDVVDNNVEQDKFRIGHDTSTILDQYIGREELEELILEEENVFNNDLP